MTSISPGLSSGEIFKFRDKKEIYIKCKYKSIKIIKIFPKKGFLKIVKTI